VKNLAKQAKIYQSESQINSIQSPLEKNILNEEKLIEMNKNEEIKSIPISKLRKDDKKNQ